MSNTDTHRPEWVRERDPWCRREFRADHDHSDGVCDFALRWDNPLLPWSATSCHIAYTGHRQVCGCRMCTWYWGRRMTRRRGRHDEQRLCRELRKNPRAADGIVTRVPVKDVWASHGVRGKRPEPAE